jgi:hypothetical protein
MNTKKIMWLNGVLFLVILGTAVMIINQERFLPGEPPVKSVKKKVTRMLAEDTTKDDEQNDQFTSLGKVNMFEAIIPLPTPTPKPTPTPPKPPGIREVTEFWKLNYVLGTMSGFQHMKTEKDFHVKLGEGFEETYRGKTYVIFLDSIDKKKFTATIRMEALNVTQTHTFNMFE